MSEQQHLLRLMTQANKEAVVTIVPIASTPSRFFTQLTKTYKRKNFSVYNSGGSIGYYGYSSSISATSDSMTIPVGAWIDIPVAAEIENDVSGEIIQVYFCTATGASGELRIEELS